MLIFKKYYIFLLLLSLSFFHLNYSHSTDDLIGYIWHITDPHIDINYTVGSDPDCYHSHKIPNLCCRKTSTQQKRKAGLYGTPNAICDIPLVTFESALDFMKKYKKDVNGIFYTGDSPPHDPLEHTLKSNLRDVLLVMEKIGERFGEEVPLVMSLGNLDGYPENDLGKPPIGSWLINPVSEVMKKYFSEEVCEMFKKKGYFSYKFDENFKVLAINTQYVNPNNLMVIDYPIIKKHPMVEWIRSELNSSRSLNEKVIINGHIFPSNEGCAFKVWNEEFDQIINEFRDVIVINLFGHEHRDRFVLGRDEKDNPISINFVSSSITTKSNKNPSVRLISYNRTNNQIIDILTFYNNITKSNLEGSMENNWILEYSMKEVYKLIDFSPKSFEDLLVRFQENDNNPLWDKFVKFMSASFSSSKCEGNCKIKLICSMKYSDREKVKKCIENSIR